MYVEYWNLKENPFLNATDTRYLFAGDQHEEAIARFSFLAESGRQAGVLTGPYGVGKSTILQHVAWHAEKMRIPVIRLDAIPDGKLAMARHILARMNIDGPSETLSEALMCFTRALELSSGNHLTRILLCIDEAHYLALENGLYLVHYLSNLRLLNKSSGRDEPLFTIILAGSTDLLEAIRDEPSLSQRMQIVFDLSPLTEEQTTAYIHEHLRAAGGDLWVFEREALDAIFHFSGGIPRRINLLCDTALMLGYAGKVNHISASVINQAASDIGMSLPVESNEGEV